MEEQELQALVEQAEVRKGWYVDGSSIGNHTTSEFIAEAVYREDARVIVNAIRAIPIQRDIIVQKNKEIAELKRQNEVLQIKHDEMEVSFNQDSPIAELNRVNKKILELFSTEQEQP